MSPTTTFNWKPQGMTAQAAYDHLHRDLIVREQIFLSIYAGSVAPISGIPTTTLAVPTATEDQVKKAREGVAELAKAVAELKKEADKEIAEAERQTATPAST